MQGGDTMAMINSLFPFVLMGGIFYFMLWRPQKQEQKRRQDLLNGMKKGDKIITIGGMYGTITALTEKKATIELAENVQIDILRTAISGYQDPSQHNNA